MESTENLWDEQLLWTKAKSYIDLALESDRESWLFPFWSTLALELLARAALSHIHPTLLASTSERDGKHLFYALNRVPKAKTYIPKSIDSADVFSRCEEILEDFTKEHHLFCTGMIGRRNEELHSGGAPFVDLNVQAWLPRYYECCTIFLEFIGKNLIDFIGKQEAGAAEKMIKALSDDAAKEVTGEIKAFKKVWESKEKSAQVVAAKKASEASLRIHGHVVPCPACGSKALLHGEEVSGLPSQIDGDMIVARTVMLPVVFKCVACGLTIKGHNKLHAAGLGSTFTRTVRVDPVDYYGLEEPYEPEPDFND